jgi:hypothetical protein
MEELARAFEPLSAILQAEVHNARSTPLLETTRQNRINHFQQQISATIDDVSDRLLGRVERPMNGRGRKFKSEEVRSLSKKLKQLQSTPISPHYTNTQRSQDMRKCYLELKSAKVEEMQRRWRETVVRDLHQMDNGLGKVFERSISSILESRDRFLTIFQGGFRGKRSCIDQILSLNQLIHYIRRKTKTTAHVALLDITAAYDTVNRNKLWKILNYYGIPECGIRIFQGLENRRFY